MTMSAARQRMSFGAYQQLDAVNISTLLAMLVSPKEYRHRRKYPPRDTKAMRVGRAAHTAILEPMQFLREYVLEPEEFADAKGKMVPTNRSLKSYKTWRDAQEASGKTVLSAEQYGTAERMQDAVRSHKIAAPLLREGEREVTITWTDPVTGLPCKGRLDWLSSDILDIKGTRHASQYRFAQQAAQLNYHTRLAWYLDGVALALNDPPNWPRAGFVIAVQNEGAHDVVVYRMPPEAIEAGRRRYQGLMLTLADCLAADEWPGVAEEEILPLQLPSWVVDAGIDCDLEVST